MTVVMENPETQISRFVSKAKLGKNGGVEVEFEQTVTFVKDDGELEMTGGSTYAGRNLAHPDLLHAFELFRAHLAIITEMPEAKDKSLQEMDDDSLSLDKFKVNSFSVGGSGDSAGVTLSGFKKLSGGRVLNLNTPFTKFFDEKNPYDYTDELQALVSHAQDMVLDYLDGKVAPSAQTEIPYDKTGDDEPT